MPFFVLSRSLQVLASHAENLVHDASIFLKGNKDLRHRGMMLIKAEKKVLVKELHEQEHVLKLPHQVKTSDHFSRSMAEAYQLIVS